MPTYRTSKGRPVRHCHVKPQPVQGCLSRDWTAAEKDQKAAELADRFPDYVQIDPPTCKFNCHGYAFTPAHGWFNFPNLFIEDDFTEVPMSHPRVGDIIVYQDSNGKITHSGHVEKVSNNHVKVVRSKMGRSATVLHDPLDVDDVYGSPSLLLRRPDETDDLIEFLQIEGAVYGETIGRGNPNDDR